MTYGVRTSEEIVRAIGVSTDRVRALLSESAERGVVQGVGADGWRLHPALPDELVSALRVLVEAGS